VHRLQINYTQKKEEFELYYKKGYHRHHHKEAVKMPYKLRSTLVGHEEDVRAVAPATHLPGAVLTASRDQSCRLWVPEDNGCFTQSNIFCGHTKYVAAVTTMPASEAYPQGLVITGGHDNLILGFDFNSPEPIWKLEGHTGTVCALDAGKFGTILSGSWDKTARVWINGKVVMTLDDHEAAVWAVKMLPDRGLMLTASADKTIKLWKAGKCEHTYTGHKDCIRALALLSSEEFLSCSNDGTIRRWTLSGDCVQIYEGHTNFVYSIAVLPGQSDIFVSSGEDRAVKVWKGGNCIQTIMMPCQSVWSVTFLENGDIVAGTSDSVTRIFTSDEALYATDEEIKDFEDCVSNQAIPAAANLDLGDIKIDQLPGPEALLVPGSKQEQTKLIKKDGIVEAHQWDTSAGQWKKVGEVTGAAGEEGTKRTDGKEEYEGKLYDYIFNIDIKEGAPPLKLPFNITDDPWMAAQTFLHKNELSQAFLDQVANFIIGNTKGITIGAAPSNVSDPFTGQGRYVPGSAAVNTQSTGSDPFTGHGRYVPGNAQNNIQSGGSDPFTGQGRYVPAGTPGNNVEMASPNKSVPNESNQFQYFPEKNYLKFVTGKSTQIISKLKEFNVLVEADVQLKEDELQVVNDIVCDLLRSSCQLREGVINSIFGIIPKFSKWPMDKLVPVLDVLRLLVLDDSISAFIFDNSQHNQGNLFVDNLMKIAMQLEPIPNILLAFRICTNSFISPDGALVLYEHRKDILDCSENLYAKNHKNLSIALSSLMVNFSVYCVKMNHGFEDRVLFCTFFNTFLGMVMDDESVFRLLVAFGTLVHSNEPAIKYAMSLGTYTIIETISNKVEVGKVKDCALSICRMFQL